MGCCLNQDVPGLERMYRDALTRLYEPESAASPFVPLRDTSEAAPTGHEQRDPPQSDPDASVGASAL